MRRALLLARRAVGSVSPNPAVGAVVVKDGVVVGEGWTQPPGGDHAEVMALREAGEKAAGAALYVTLEPCDHQGRTPPCSSAIVEAGIAELHASLVDPHPKVSGNGLARLREAGMRTVLGEGDVEARKVMEAYLRFITTGLPFVTAKFAMSLDGKIATRTGDSKWVTHAEARTYAHRLRAASDAVMVGINTVITDEPRLTARDGGDVPLERQPLRVVVDSRGRTPPGARLLSEPGATLIAVGRVEPAVSRSLEDAGAEIEAVPREDGSVDLERLIRRLGCDRRVSSLLVEGGGTVLGSLFDRQLVHKVVAFVAPTIIGGRDAAPAVGGLGASLMSEALQLTEVEFVELGRVIAVIGYIRS